MGYDNGMITKPVSIRDVQRAIGSSQTDLGTLCTHNNINKWAWYKPIKCNKIGVLTEEDLKNNFYGLFFRENAAAKTLLIAPSGSRTVDMFDSAAAANHEWSYTPPAGGTTSPYRLTDFACGHDDTKGYKHDTIPPFEIEGDWGVVRSILKKVANTYSVTPSSSQPNATITISENGREIPIGNIFLGYSMAYNGDAQFNFNRTDNNAIPMTYLLAKDPENNSAINLDSANWRIGMIVFVPQAGVRSAYSGLFVSKKVIRDTKGTNGMNYQDLSVEMCTNQELAFYMNEYMNYNNITEHTFRALPVLVLNAIIGTIGNDQGKVRSVVNPLSQQNTKIYPLPTGNAEIGIKIMNDQQIDDTTDGESNGFILGITCVAMAGYDPINAIIITYPSSIPSAKTAHLDIEYADDEGTYAYDGTYAIPAQSTFRAHGEDYNGVIFQHPQTTKLGGKRLHITAVKTFIVS